jgi:geranylgeranyl diphosphate/geranylgeranyl-bacteriochlorophyllide a reductase
MKKNIIRNFMQNNFDFLTNTLIIGGGPAGSTLARKLSKNNIDNILIEKNFTFDKPCGGGIKSIVFNEFDLPKILETKQIVKFNLINKKKKIPIDLSKTPISIVLRKEFDKTLRELAQKDGTKLLEAKYINSESFEDFIISRIQSDNKILLIKSKYLVGADGVKSTVRKEILKDDTNSHLTNYSLIENSPIDYCDFYFGKDFAPNEYAWVFPHGNKLSIGSILKNNDAKKIFENFKEKTYKNEKTKGYFIASWNEEKIFYKKRTFFVGDAAGQILPFTYEGIYFAMKSAHILADAIIRNDPYLYEKNWNKIYLKKFRLFKRLQNIFLKNDFFVNLMILLFSNKKFQEKSLGYWEGSLKPVSIYKILFKLSKYLFKK